jgi:predicted dithiol-disulfide oxidoreductase (DUF899 family)
LLEREKEATRLREAVNAERRALPWVRIDKEYLFDTPQGQAPLAALFDGRPQLFVYHFMFRPGATRFCKSCSFIADHVDAARQHFEHAGLSFVAVSRAPLALLEPVRQRMGWRFNWVSSGGSDFNYDFGVSFTPDQISAGQPLYNFGTTPLLAEDLHGCSVFAKDGSGDVFHTYSAYGRGVDPLMGAFSFLDMVPLGRGEVNGPQDWVRLHDEYPA